MAPQPAGNRVPDLCVFHPHSASLLVNGAGRVACRAVPVGMGSGKQVAEDLRVAGPLGCVGVGGVGWWRVCQLEGTIGACVAVTTCAGGLDRDRRVEAAGADPAEEEEKEACEEGDTGWRRLVRWSFSSVSGTYRCCPQRCRLLHQVGFQLWRRRRPRWAQHLGNKHRKLRRWG